MKNGKNGLSLRADSEAGIRPYSVAMRYPTIGQYLESFANPYQLFRTLREFEAKRDLHGDIVFMSGNYSAVFRVVSGGGSMALKCYTRKPEHAPEAYAYLREASGSPYLVPFDYLPDELLVYDEYDKGGYFPVLLSPWVEGQTLGEAVERLCLCSDGASQGELERLAEAFDRMALWLLQQEFAHGDLKHDNIMVTPQGELRLIDCDGLWFPAAAGRSCGLIGSPAYQHPARDAAFFNGHIDDYPLCVISVSLHALAEEPELYGRYNEVDNLILDPKRILAGECELVGWLEQRWMRQGRSALVRLCRMLRSPSPLLPELPGAVRTLCAGVPAAIPPQTEIVDDSDPRAAVVCCRGRYGYADLEAGRLLIEPLYREAKPFRESLAAVRADAGWCFIDRLGRVAIDCPDYDRVEPFSEGLALVRCGGLYGFIDREGEEAIAPRYPFATGFRESFAVVRTSRGYGYIDRSGNPLSETAFDFAARFRNGAAYVEKDGNAFQIDKTGNRIRSGRKNSLHL